MSAGQDFVVARRIVLTVLSLIFGIPVALIAWLFLLEWTITYWPWSTLIPLAFVAFVAAVIRGVRRREKYRQIAARADYEHHALTHGNTPLGMFGQYPPKETP